MLKYLLFSLVYFIQNANTYVPVYGRFIVLIYCKRVAEYNYQKENSYNQNNNIVICRTYLYLILMIFASELLCFFQIPHGNGIALLDFPKIPRKKIQFHGQTW